MKSLILIFCGTMLFSACSTSKQIPISQLYGKYYWQITHPYDVGANIQLNSDKTFEYNWREGLLWGTTFGVWELKKNTLILNSNKQPEKTNKETHNLLIQPSAKENELEVKLIDKKTNEPLFLAICLLKYNSTVIEEVLSDEFGVCILTKYKQAKKLHISSLGCKDLEVSLDSLTGNSYTIEIPCNLFSYYNYFTNRKWRIKGNRIYDPKIKTDKYTEKYYLKVK
ncbi:MAG: hypothetical protein ACPG49_02360 [Chitinophagales bacterium]